MTLIRCHCGRSIKGLGWASHARACPVERARSAAFVAAVERGEDAVAASTKAARRARAVMLP